MANWETKFQLILLNSPGRYDYGKIHWSGSDTRVASGHDGPTRHQRRAVSARRSVGRTTSQWKLRSQIEQKKKLLQFLAARVNGELGNKVPTNFAQFAGTIRLREDPLVGQRHARREWA